MGKTLEVIVHCVADQIPAFASMLTAELSSLVLYPPKCQYKITVVTSPKDELTLRVAEAFSSRLPDGTIKTLEIEPPAIYRRAIGRNIAAKRSNADVVYFADADYLWLDGCLDAVANIVFDAAKMVYPREAMIHRSHEAGDVEIDRVVPGDVFTPDLSIFEPWRIHKAIGGLQIVPGDVARQGYLDGTAWTDVVAFKHFENTHCDKHFRRACGGATGIDLPGFWRFRHSESAFQGKEKRLRKAGKS